MMSTFDRCEESGSRSILPLLAALGLLLVLAVTLVVGVDPAQATGPCDRYVLGIDASDSSDCSNPVHPCRTVQFAIDQATSGDRICVADHILAPGPTIYAENLVVTKTLTLDGAWEAACVDPSDLKCSFTPLACDPARVVLDGGGVGRVIHIEGAITPTIDCFTITGGSADNLLGDPDGFDAGGGIFGLHAAPIIVNNIISGNFGCNACSYAYGRGGGIYLHDAPATAIIDGNLIAHNVAAASTWGQGGGMMLHESSAQVSYNTIEYNEAGGSAGDGGGIAVQGGGTVNITHNEVMTNVAAQAVMGNGGGVFAWQTMTLTIEDNVIRDNKALTGPAGAGGLVSRGGGIHYQGEAGSAATIRRNQVAYNLASFKDDGNGGGLYLEALNATDTIAANTVLENFASVEGLGKGGGYAVFSSTATVDGGLVQGNYGSPGDDGWGGGLYAQGGSLVVASAVFSNNVASVADNIGRGGGMYVEHSNARVVGNTFYLNYGTLHAPPGAGSGGGLYLFFCDGSLVEDNRFDHNEAPIYGGGVYLQASDGMTLTGNTMIDNQAHEGGGAYVLHDDDVLLEANTVVSNTATRGGGLYLYDSAARLDNNIVSGNVLPTPDGGAGIWIHGDSAQLRHNTIADNQNGSGIQVTGYWGGDGEADLTNTILVSHTVGIDVATGMTATLEATLWGNTVDWGSAGTIATGTVNVWGAPAFVDPANHDYHITFPSPATDAGLASAVDDDIDGHFRPYAAPDLGADEIVHGALTPGAGGTLVYTDTQGNPITIEVPPNAVSETLTLVYTPVNSTSTAVGLSFAGHAFDLAAYSGGELLPGYLFGEPVLVTIHYSDGDVTGLDETALRLLYWDGSAWADAACGPYDRHPENNWLSVPICHLSRFSLQARNKVWVYLPVVFKSQ